MLHLLAFQGQGSEAKEKRFELPLHPWRLVTRFCKGFFVGAIFFMVPWQVCVHWFTKCHEQPSMKSYLLLVFARMYFGNIQSHTVFHIWNWPWNLFSKSARHCNFEKKQTSDTSCLLKNAKPREVFLEDSTFFSKIKPLTFDYFPANVSSFSSPLVISFSSQGWWWTSHFVRPSYKTNQNAPINYGFQ